DAARRLLLRLYEAATSLPLSEPGDHEASAEPLRPKSWPGFDHLDGYWEVFDPYEQDEPVAASLSDDLLDIYADLKRGLALLDSNAVEASAVWEWRFHFDVHWGAHAIDALRALHRACDRAATSV